MQSRTANKNDLTRFDALRAIGCIVCLLWRHKYTPPQIHHLTGKTAPGAHTLTIGLCYLHHGPIDKPDFRLYTPRHPYKTQFEKRYCCEWELLGISNILIDALAKELIVCPGIALA